MLAGPPHGRGVGKEELPTERRRLVDSAADRAAAKIKTILWWGDFAFLSPQCAMLGE